MTHLQRTLVAYCQSLRGSTAHQIATRRGDVIQAIVALPHELEQIKAQLKSRVPFGDPRRQWVASEVATDEALAEKVVYFYVDGAMSHDIRPTTFDIAAYTTDHHFAMSAGKRIRKWIDRLRIRKSTRVTNLVAPAIVAAPPACAVDIDEEDHKIRVARFENDLMSCLASIKGTTRRLKPENLMIACALADFSVDCKYLPARAWHEMAAWSKRFILERAKQSRHTENWLQNELVSVLSERRDGFEIKVRKLLKLEQSDACNRIARVEDVLYPKMRELHHKYFS